MELFGDKIQVHNKWKQDERRKPMKKQELLAQMARHGDTYKDLAAALGKTYTAVWQKINGVRPFTQSEIQTIIDRYNLKAKDIQVIFFASEVS